MFTQKQITTGIVAVCLFLGLMLGKAFGQTNKPQPTGLEKEILAMDSTLTAAFNTQDLPKLKSLFSTDLEFYHDINGKQDLAEVTSSFERMFASGRDVRRMLLKEQNHVYPLANEGAIQKGTHRFCSVENGKESCGTFEFVHVWEKRQGRWVITRIISYGH